MPGPSTFALVDQARHNLKKLESFITTGMDNCEDLSLDIVENGKDDADHLSELKSVMLDYIKMEKELKHFLEATDAVKRLAKHSEESLNLEELLDEKLHEISATSEEEDFTKHTRYVDMDNKISDLLSTVNPAACSTNDQESTEIDEDITVKQEMVTKCPYTGKEMHDPVRNIHCNHNYDRDGITEAMKLRRGKTRCPVPGCINDKPVTLSDLEENHELRRYIEKKNRQLDKKNKKT